MTPGALQQRQMSSISESGLTQPKSSSGLNVETRGSSPASTEVIVVTQQSQNVSCVSINDGSPTRLLKTHAAIRNINLLYTEFDMVDRWDFWSKNEDSIILEFMYTKLVEDAVKWLMIGNHADVQILNKLFAMMCKLRAAPTLKLAHQLCNWFRKCGGTDLLIKNCVSEDPKIQFSSARLLVEFLCPENLDYVVKHGLKNVMHVVCKYRRKPNGSTEESKVSTGILAKLFEYTEATCSEVIQLYGLDVLMAECQSRDADVLRNCARALANLSLYGGAVSHERMVHCHAHTWLLALAFAADDGGRYHALLAAAVLVADRFVGGACDALDLIDPFVKAHAKLADLSSFGSVGQSRCWLRRLVPVLRCDRREARTLAALHFCAEAEAAGPLAHDRMAAIFGEIGAVESLRILAGSPDGDASGFAARALRSIGQQVPRPLSQQVTGWTAEDVVQWIKGAGLGGCAECLEADHSLDGHWLLTLTEERLGEREGMRNGIMRKRFMRELHKLKQLADYSCIDPTNLNSFLQLIGSEFSIYTYSILKAGFDRESIKGLSVDELKSCCGITNSIHRQMIIYHIKDVTDMEKFISFSS